MRVPALAEKSWGEGPNQLHLDDLAGGQRLLGPAEATIPGKARGFLFVLRSAGWAHEAIGAILALRLACEVKSPGLMFPPAA